MYPFATKRALKWLIDPSGFNLPLNTHLSQQHSPECVVAVLHPCAGAKKSLIIIIWKIDSSCINLREDDCIPRRHKGITDEIHLCFDHVGVESTGQPFLYCIPRNHFTGFGQPSYVLADCIVVSHHFSTTVNLSNVDRRVSMCLYCLESNVSWTQGQRLLN